MKGLLLKDFYMLKTYMRSLILIVVVFFAVSALGQGSSFMIIYPIIIISMLAVTLISYDERFHWDRYCDAMPCSRAMAVSEKYVITLMGVTLCIALTALCQFFSLRRGNIDLSGYKSILLIAVGFGFFTPSIMLPVIFALGAEKGRIGYYVCVGAMCALSLFVMDDPTQVNDASLNLAPALPVVAPVVIVLFALSWLLSIRFYKKREL